MTSTRPPNSKRRPSITSRNQKIAVGFRVHSGWAAAVVVAGSIDEPVVLDRRRIVIADRAIPGSKQPFHASEDLPIEKAEQLIGKCRARSIELATEALRGLLSIGELRAAAVLFASGRELPDLAATLRSHALIHTAEGEFFREVVMKASEACGLPVTRIRERELRDLQPKIAELRKSLGAPWTEDEKLASLGAWKALDGLV